MLLEGEAAYETFARTLNDFIQTRSKARPCPVSFLCGDLAMVKNKRRNTGVVMAGNKIVVLQGVYEIITCEQSIVKEESQRYWKRKQCENNLNMARKLIELAGL